MSATQARADRAKVNFTPNVPQLVTLEYNPPTTAREGRFGDQYMYFLDGHKILWADPPLHESIRRSGAKAGSDLAIMKRKQGQRVTWEVATAKDGNREALATSTALAAELAQSAPAPATRSRTLPPAKPLEKRLPAEKFVTPATRDAIIRESLPAAPPVPALMPSNPMATALQQALDAVQITGFQARREDVRAMAITIYIQAFGGKR